MTRKKYKNFINKTVNFFKKKNLFNKKTQKKDILKLCTPPPNNKNKINKILNTINKINIKPENITGNTIRVLWSDWIKYSQLFACLFAEKLSNYKVNSKAIEQTILTEEWLKRCGNWDMQEKNIGDFLKVSNKKIHLKTQKKLTNKIRKDIWDEFSLKFAKYPCNNTLIVLPYKLDNNFFNKTLFKIELPNLKTKTVCIVIIKNINEIIINPHLNTKYTINIKNNKNIIFEFNPFNKKQIIDFLKNYK